MDVSVIVVSYNTRELTLDCLRSVHRQTRDVEYEVLVVDNASSDGSSEAIRAAAFPGTRIVELPTNVGFARANNLAAAEARGEFLLLLNPDTVVLDGAIQEIVGFARRRPECGIYGGRTFFPDGRLNPSSCWRRSTLWSTICMASGLSAVFGRKELFDPEGMGSWARDSVRHVDIVSGCFFLLPRDLWRRLEGFDPAFFMYGEDADLCLRARALGARPVIDPAATIVHHGGASEPVRADKLVRVLSARVRLMRRHWAPRWARLGVPLVELRCMGRASAWRILSALGHPRAKASADCWTEVWRRRKEWASVPRPERAPAPEAG